VRIIFAGTPQFAAAALDALIPKHTVVAVLTQPDRPAGRGMQLTSSPVKQSAIKHGIQVLQPATLKDKEIQALIAGLNADVMVVAAYGLILPKAVLDTPKYGCLNIHASLLPRWRGAAPIQRAIQAGDAETGITIMQMDEGLDTGAMLLRESCSIAAHDSAHTLHDKLAHLGVSSILAVLGSEASIDWHLDAVLLERTIRALNPFPLCNFNYRESVIKVWQASLKNEQGRPGEVLHVGKQGITVACGKDAVQLEVLQRPGGKAQSATQFLQAIPIKVGDVL
jgi:methionyl-tRNA formyltransferase